MNHATHLILVSVQAVPNITPLLDGATKPKCAILLVSPDMARRADWLESIAKTKGIKTQRWPITDAYNIEHIQSRVLELLESQAHPDLALNATGGTKPMSIAAYEAFRAYDKPIFYVHPEHDRLIWMHPGGRPPHDLADRIKLNDFLHSYGATVTGQGPGHGVKAELRQLTDALIAQARALADPLSILNAYAAKAERGLTCAIHDNHQRYDKLDGLISLFAQAGQISRVGHQLRFPDEAARFYVNGGWLESHVYGLCLNLKKSHGIQDIARGLEIQRGAPEQATRNELDVAFLKANRLYLIECKTHSAKTGDGGKNTDALYKLDSLKDLMGGLQAKAMLVSYTDLNPSDRERARDLGLAVCDGQALASLPNKLSAWIR